MSRAVSRGQPLSLRLPKADLAVIDRAAQLKGRSRTEFMRDAALRAAEEALLDAGLVRMSGAGFAAFEKALAGEPAEVPELVEIMQRRAPWET